MFFYLYAIVELLALFLDSAIIPTSNVVYPVSILMLIRSLLSAVDARDALLQWFAAIQVGFICALFWCLLVNGFVGFQFAEDGTPASLWVCHVSRFLSSTYFRTNEQHTTTRSASASHFSRNLRHRALHLDRYDEWLCWLFIQEHDRAIRSGAGLSHRLRGDLCRQPTDLGFEDIGRSLGQSSMQHSSED